MQQLQVAVVLAVVCGRTGTLGQRQVLHQTGLLVLVLLLAAGQKGAAVGAAAAGGSSRGLGWRA
jgi:hypothetical protein